MSNLASRLSKVSTAHVCDALDRIGVANVTLQGLMRVTEPGLTMAGPAVTIELVRARTPEAPRRISKFLDEYVSEGTVVIVAAHGVTEHVTVGGRAAGRAESQGAVGMIVDGGVRDVPELQGRGFPIFAKGFGMHASEGRLEGVRINEAVWCAGVKIEPGDWVVADDTGGVVIPANVVDEVTALAEEREEVDQETMLEIHGEGASLETAHRHFRDDDVEWLRRVE